MKDPILLVMAAGIGSRFGGLKQMTPFGRHGESLIDYSLYDAIKAGFKRVVFVINRRIEEDFRRIVGSHVEGRMDVQYVFQELDRLPKGLELPIERVKPWGTGHAVLCAADQLDAPFCAINGDDFYGRDAYVQIFDFLTKGGPGHQYAMVGFLLKNTLSEAGYVSRGQCYVDKDGNLTDVVERTHIISTTDGPLFTENNETYYRLSPQTIVSMNFWGFMPSFLDDLRERFPAFYARAMQENPLKAEYFLPNVVGALLKENKATVKVFSSQERWFGVTNPSDRPIVENALRELTAANVYPDGLWQQ